MKNNNIEEYADSAYNSNKFERQKPIEESSSILQKLGKMVIKILPWSYPDGNIICTSVYSQFMPVDWKSIKNNFITNEKILGFKGNVGMRIFLFICMFARVFITPCTPIALITYFLVREIAPEDNNIWNDILIEYFLYILLPSVIILFYKQFHFHGIQLKILSRFLNEIKVFEFNRKTGMVTFFKKNGKPKYTRPFIEFDCYFQTYNFPNGGVRYTVFLKHRYEPELDHIPLNLLMVSDFIYEHYRLWGMIQQFMDVSQPLPDTYYFEEFREKDPTTVEYDRENDRDPHYWRSMTDEEYQQRVRQIQETGAVSGPELNIFK